MSVLSVEATRTEPEETPTKTLADFLRQLGDISPYRVWMNPPLGKATESDVLFAQQHLDRLCELVDGTLVEKPMGNRESFLAALISHLLQTFVLPRKLGYVLGADSMFRLGKQIRLPDVAFVAQHQWPSGLPKAPVGIVSPNLAVEVLSASNSAAEMRRKRSEYFTAGVQLVWIVDPASRTIAVYETDDAGTILSIADTLDGGIVLPGFSIPVADIFSQLED
jgi:Uma2 family endonuclease